MKREWTYLAALLPYTTAISSSAAFGSSGDDWEAMRPKAKSNPEDGDGSSDDQNGDGGDGAGASPDVKTPGELAGGGDGGAGGGGGGGGGSNVQSSIASVPHADGMYAPPLTPGGGSHDSGGPYGGGGGGGGVSVSKTTIILHGESGGVENGGYVDPDPSDADAMMILLGGNAEGAGEGANSSGEVLFDVVDYGDITVGYGFANYQASGADGASAYTYYDVTGADLVFHFDEGDHTGASAWSKTYVLAIDFEGELDFEGQMALNADYWNELLADSPFANWVQVGNQDEEDLSIDGNHAVMAMSASVQDLDPAIVNSVFAAIEHIGSKSWVQASSEQAQLSMTVNATGIDTLASATGSLVEIEDHYSAVNGAAVMIA